MNIVHYIPTFIFILVRDDFLESCLSLKQRHAKVNISDPVCTLMYIANKNALKYKMEDVS